MRVLKTFVILDIVLYITGVTSFKCISVLLTKFLVGLEYIPSFTLTWNSSPAPVLCPPIRPRPPPPGLMICNKSMSLTAGVTFNAVGSLFNVVCQSVFPIFYEKRTDRKAAKATRGCRVLSG